MDKRFLIAGAFFGLTAVLIGAFGAHGLENLLSTKELLTFETGVKYQMYHALACLFLGVVKRVESRSKTLVLCLFVVGTVCFSWSIYGLATNALSAFDFRKIAILTPIGGGLLIIGWSVILIKALTLKKQ